MWLFQTNLKTKDMRAYKGFNPDMTCRGFQYKEGETYTEEKASLCNNGFHACEDPVDCFAYYGPAQSVFHEVELDDVDGRRDSDSKVAAKKITIGAKIDLASMIKASIDFRFSKTTEEKGGQATGYRGAASATGDSGAASATGYRGAASATGFCGAASATGYSGAASATGYRGAASATGKAGIALAAGVECKAMGALGCWIVLTERVWDEEGNYYRIKEVRALEVDGVNIKPEVWYMLKDGEVVEV